MNSRMMTRALLAVISLVGLGLIAPQTVRADFDPIFGFYRPELFSTVDSADLVRALSLRDFLDGRVPGSTALGRMGSARMVDFETMPANASPRHKANAVVGPVKDPKDGKDYSSSEALAMEKASLSWSGGELGFYYGHSAGGKFSGDEFGSYILGSVGNEHLQINVGAGYEESHFSRSRH